MLIPESAWKSKFDSDLCIDIIFNAYLEVAIVVSLSFEPIPPDSVTNIPADKEPITTALVANLSASSCHLQ